MLAGIQDHLRQGDYERALSALRDSKAHSDLTSHKGNPHPGIWHEQDRVAYWMEEGMLSLLAGQHVQSIAALHKARQRISELYTQSRRKIQASMVGTDIYRDYTGPPHEQRLVHTLLVLNFLLLGDHEAARVEAAASDELAHHRSGRHAEEAPPNAFSRWISGLAHELTGARDDARISYQHAREAYLGYQRTGLLEQTPTWLETDIARVTSARREEEDSTVASSPLEAGELFLFHFSGQGPSLEESHLECQSISYKPEEFGAIERWRPLEINHQYWFAVVRGREPWEYLVRNYQPDPDHSGSSAIKWRCAESSSRFDNGPNQVVIRVPHMAIRPPMTVPAVVFAGGRRAVAQTVHPLAQIALIYFEGARHRIHVRAAIRISTRIRYQGNGAGWIAEDRRHWTTLPHRIDVARLRLPQGEHEVTVRLQEDGPARKLGTVVISPGKRVFLMVHSL